jgi:hypothetical protein
MKISITAVVTAISGYFFPLATVIATLALLLLVGVNKLLNHLIESSGECKQCGSTDVKVEKKYWPPVSEAQIFTDITCNKCKCRRREDGSKVRLVPSD